MTTAHHPDSNVPAGISAKPCLGECCAPINDFAAMFEIRAQLQRVNEQAEGHCRASSLVVSSHRSEIEGLSELLRRLETSLREARNHVETLGVALDRIKIVALNTGLEGARLGDLAGKALIAVSDELRNLTSRGLELLSEQASSVEQMELDRQRLLALVDRSQVQMNEIESRLREILAAEQVAQRELDRFSNVLEQATGLDPESAARLGRISEQARELAASLATLAKPEHDDRVRAALLPALQPFLAWLTSSVDTKP